MAHDEDPAHPEPVEIDLGEQKAFEVEVIVTELQNEGYKLFLEAEGDLGSATEFYPKQCKLLIQPQDEEHIRRVFTEAGFL